MKIHTIGLKEYPISNMQNDIQLDYKIDNKLVVEIEYNGISKARNCEKLGLSKNKFGLLKCLKSLRPNGGKISMIDVFVLKKYHPIYKKFKEGKKIKK